MAATAVGITIPPTYVLRRPSVYVVVGCGGTGSRLVPALVKILGEDDTVVLVDGDRVEERNLLRQHFVAADVGRYKAEVLAERYTVDGGPWMVAHNLMFDENYQYPSEVHNGRHPRSGQRCETGHACVIGCVDSRQARHEIVSWLGSGVSALWLDCGNERYSGQVLLTIQRYPTLVKQLRQVDPQVTVGRPSTLSAYMPGIDTAGTYARDVGHPLQMAPSRSIITDVGWYLTARTLEDIMPTLVDPSAADPTQVNCAIRIDTQTVASNMMAAACAINILTYVVDGIPTSTLGMLFDISGVMQQVRMRRVDPNSASMRYTTQVELVQPQFGKGA